MLKVYQSAFIHNPIETDALRHFNPVSTPQKASNFLKIQGEDDNKKVNLKTYQRLISKLMYLSCNTKLDISLVIGQLSK